MYLYQYFCSCKGELKYLALYGNALVLVRVIDIIQNEILQK